MRVGVALLGCGAIASAVHLRILRRLPGARLVGVADPSDAARARVRESARVEAVSDPRELLERPDVTAVVVCAPTHLHAELAVAALEQGKHLYLEKPIATAHADAVRLVEAAAGAGAVAMCGFNHRFHPLHERGRSLLAAGAIGSVHAVQTAFCEPVDPERMPVWKRRRATGGGALLDLASHQLDLVRWYLDDEIAEVGASVASLATEDDVASVELRTARGVAVSGTFSLRSGRCDYVRFVGERGLLTVDRYAPRLELGLSRTDVGAVRRRRLPPAWRPSVWQAKKLARPAFEPSYRRALARFVRVAAGGEGDYPTLEDGLRSLEAVLAAERAARAGAPVALRS